MKVLELDGGFGLEKLHLVDRPEPVPGPLEVLLAVRAASLNYRDLLMVRGEYDPRQSLPLVPCSDGAGTVVAIGSSVRDVAVGDRVLPIFAQGWVSGEPRREYLRTTLGGPLDGTLCQLMAVPATATVPVAAHLTDAEAACLPCAAVTAWSALVTHGQVHAGDTVLLQGTGGVSLAALQFARLHGARVIVTSSSDEKLERARHLGAYQGINYHRDRDWGKTARKLTGGVDLVVDVGGAATLQQSLTAVRPGGTVCLVGNLGGRRGEIDLAPLFMQSVRVQGVLVGPRTSCVSMMRAIDQHRLRPVVDSTYPLESTREAFERLASGQHFGKITLAIDA